MLEFSATQFFCKPNEKKKTINIKNKYDSPLLYKVKTNNIEAIDAKPNIGLIHPGKSLDISIACLKQKFTAKIQIIYAVYKSDQGQFNPLNVPTYWGTISKQQTKFRIIPIARDEQKQIKIDQSLDKSQMFVSQIKPQPQIYKSQKIEDQKPIHLIDEKLNMIKQQQQSLLSKQKSSNSQESKQLERVRYQQLKENQLTDQMKSKLTSELINKSQCSAMHISLIKLLMIIALAFMLGFLTGNLYNK